MRLWRLLGHYDAETTPYSACAGALQASPYTPDFSGTLVGLRTIAGRQAVTSLTNQIQFRLTCTTFRPNSIECQAQGSGIQTAPADQAPPIDWSVQQAVQSGVPIHVEGRCEGDTHVTNSAQVWGCFETA